MQNLNKQVDGNAAIDSAAVSLCNVIQHIGLMLTQGKKRINLKIV